MANGAANKRRDVEKILESTNHINSNDDSDAEETLHDTLVSNFENFADQILI